MNFILGVIGFIVIFVIAWWLIMTFLHWPDK